MADSVKFLILLILTTARLTIGGIPWEEYETEYWTNKGQQELQQRLTAQNFNLNRAKNIIMFLGDGMSISTLTAARILKGQRNDNPGEEEYLSFEKFPYSGLSKTYCVNGQVADSACSATAYLCGVKGNVGTIGVNANVEYGDCDSMSEEDRVSSLATWAQEKGMSAGIVTTARVTDASPAGTYAHTPARTWQKNAEGDCKDIAQQLITEKPGRDFEVILGGGREMFEGGRNLIKEWQRLHPRGEVVTSRSQWNSLNIGNASHILGLLADRNLGFHLESAKTPTLTEMTEVAIRQLSKNKTGFFLFIEGGLIDKAHHGNRAHKSLDETIELEKAVQRARDMTDPKDTLIVVTADHAHGLTISGESKRGNSILGLSGSKDEYGNRFATLNYATGQNQYMNSDGEREDLSDQAIDMKYDHDFTFPSYINKKNAKHTGEDVGIYASGPYEHLFSGVMEQSSIPHMIAYAACIGNGKTMCNNK